MVRIDRLHKEVIKACRPLIMEDDNLFQYMTVFRDAIHLALDNQTKQDSTVTCSPTFIDDIPKGSETGSFMVVQIEGQIITITMVTFQKDVETDYKIRKFKIPDARLTGSGVRLFNYIAKCMSTYLYDSPQSYDKIPMAFIFSFPLEQHTLQNATLKYWTKGFDCDGVVGENISQRLKVAFRRFLNLRSIYITAVISSSSSFLMSAIMDDRSCKIGAVIGSGVSFSYREKSKNIGLVEGDDANSPRTIINMDASCLGDDQSLDFLRNEFDLALDEESVNPGQQINEKMVSSIYIPELVRLCVIQLIEKDVLLFGVVTDKLREKNALTVDDIIHLEMDDEKNHSNCQTIFKKLGYEEVPGEDCIQIQFISRCFVRRAASLIAAMLATLVHRIHDREISIALDVDFVKEYPQFKIYLCKAMGRLKRKDVKCDLFELDDKAVTKGAALVAAVYADEIIKLEDGWKKLPPYEVRRCTYKITGQKCTDCHCPKTTRCFPCKVTYR